MPDEFGPQVHLLRWIGGVQSYGHYPALIERFLHRFQLVLRDRTVLAPVALVSSN